MAGIVNHHSNTDSQFQLVPPNEFGQSELEDEKSQSVSLKQGNAKRNGYDLLGKKIQNKWDRQTTFSET